MFSRSRVSKILARVIVLLTVAALTACVYLPEPTTTELTGVWVNGETRLTLMEDSTFTLEDAPAYTGPLGDKKWWSETSTSYDASGKWTLQTKSDSLWLSETAGHNMDLSITQSFSERVLFFGINLGGDARCLELVREGSDKVPKGPEDCVMR